MDVVAGAARAGAVGEAGAFVEKITVAGMPRWTTHGRSIRPLAANWNHRLSPVVYLFKQDLSRSNHKRDSHVNAATVA